MGRTDVFMKQSLSAPMHTCGNLLPNGHQYLKSAEQGSSV